MKRVFKDLAIGERFTDGIAKAQRKCDVDMYEVLVKTTKSIATVVEQIGYGNTRAVGDKRKYATLLGAFTGEAGGYVI